MSMNDFESAMQLITKFPENSDFSGGHARSVIYAAEKKLDISFPPTYRRFLQEYGSGSFGSEMFFGIVDSTFNNPGASDAVWYTLTLRNEKKCPKNYIVVYEVGDGELFCLDIGGDKVEAPVITFQPGWPNNEQFIEVIAQDFGQFFYETIKKQAENWKIANF